MLTKVLRLPFQKSSRGRKKSAGGRARRSADDPEALDDANLPATSEESAQKGLTSVKAVTDGVAALSTGDEATKGGRKSRGAKKSGKAAAPRRERGEVSKTVRRLPLIFYHRHLRLMDCFQLVHIRNIPYNSTEESITALLESHNLKASHINIPVHKYGLHKGQGRGFAFAQTGSEDEQKQFIEALNGKEINSSGEAASSATPTATEGEATEGENAAASSAPASRVFKLLVRPAYDQDLKPEAENTGGM